MAGAPIFRSYQPADAEAVLPLFMQAIKTVYPTIEAGEWTSDLENIEDAYIKGGGDFLVGVEGETIIAVGGLHKINETTAEMKKVGVRPNFQGRGLGQGVVDALEHRARKLGFAHIVLDTTEGHVAARRLYDKNGYEIVDRKEVVHQSGMTFDTYFYEKQIKPIVIETERSRLVLRQMLGLKDDQDYYDLQNRNIDYWSKFGNSIDKDVAEVTKRRLEHGNHRFGIWFEGKLVGMAGYSTKGHEREAEVGILLEENASGKGIATISAKALTEYAKPRYDRVYAEVEPDNASSISLMKRVGYETNGEVVKRNWGNALVFEATK